jgi:hypothetical protein
MEPLKLHQYLNSRSGARFGLRVGPVKWEILRYA